MNNFLFVCQRCQNRLEKKGCDTAFEWSDDSFKQMKFKYKKETGEKPDPRVVLTSCLGFCPENAISFVECKNGQLEPESSYPHDLDQEGVFKKVFKTE